MESESAACNWLTTCMLGMLVNCWEALSIYQHMSPDTVMTSTRLPEEPTLLPWPFRRPGQPGAPLWVHMPNLMALGPVAESHGPRSRPSCKPRTFVRSSRAGSDVACACKVAQYIMSLYRQCAQDAE